MTEQMRTKSSNWDAQPCPQQMTVCHADALIEVDRHFADISKEPWVAHTTNWIANVHNACQRTLHKTCPMWHPLVTWHITAVVESSFYNSLLTADETWANHLTPTTRKASMTWRHSYPLTPQRKKLKVVPQVRKSLAPVWWQPNSHYGFYWLVPL
jgi:hypothetical protein